jgi:predicted  nucleic acid-binding Zn-ribbon protein
MARKEEIFISELSSEAPERETVTKRIITRSKETIDKLTTVKDELKDKKTKITEESTGLKKDITDLTEKLTSIQAKISTQTESLKLKTAERKSKRDILASMGVTAGANTPTSEGYIVTQGSVDKLTKEVTELRSKIKKNIQQKNEYFSTKITTQKTVDIYINQVKTIEAQIKNLKDFISEVEGTVKGVEGKMDEEAATKKVIETQKKAFKAA